MGGKRYFLSSVLWGGVLASWMPGTAHPAERMMVVSVGDCASAELSKVGQALHGALTSRAGANVQEPPAFFAQARPVAAKTEEEIRRQLESAETHFYNARNVQAAKQVAEALVDIQLWPPGPQRREWVIKARLMEALILRGMNRASEADESFRQVLRLSPSYRMDPNLFAPSTRAAFDRARKQLAAKKKARLVVTSTPAEAEVFLDGVLVGRTPFSSDVPPGPYQLQVVKGVAQSFPRPLQLAEGGEALVTVDLGFEGSIVSGHPLCLWTRSEPSDPFRNAVKLGALTGVEEAVVLRLQQLQAGPAWVTVSLLSVQGGQKVREGSLKISESSHLSSLIQDLASFVVTGQSTPHLVQMPVESSPSVEVKTPPPQVVIAQKQSSQEGLHPLKWSGFAAMGAGVVALASAGVLYQEAKDDMAILSLRASGRALRAHDVPGAQLYSNLKSRSRVINGLMVGGTLATVAGAVLVFIPTSTRQVQAVAAASSTETGVFVYGRF